jgi:CheY-like chemotaxis protein
MQYKEIKFSKVPRILIVEDDASQRKLLVKFIKDAFECNILEVSDGLDALKIMLRDKQKPDLILLDLMLPALSGIEFLGVVRGRPEFDEVPVVVCTSVAETKETRGLMEGWIVGYLVKPINRAKLLEKLMSALQDIKFRVSYQ